MFRPNIDQYGEIWAHFVSNEIENGPDWYEIKMRSDLSKSTLNLDHCTFPQPTPWTVNTLRLIPTTF